MNLVQQLSDAALGKHAKPGPPGLVALVSKPCFSQEHNQVVFSPAYSCKNPHTCRGQGELVCFKTPSYRNSCIWCVLSAGATLHQPEAGPSSDACAGPQQQQQQQVADGQAQVQALLQRLAASVSAIQEQQQQQQQKPGGAPTGTESSAAAAFKFVQELQVGHTAAHVRQ